MAMLILGKVLRKKYNLRKERVAMSVPKVDKEKTQVKLVFGEIEAGQFPLDRLMEEMHLEFHAFATSAGVLVMKALMEAEEKHLAGERQSHETEVNRWGKQPGSVIVGGQKVVIDRQRLRKRSGGEVELSSYQCFHANDARAHAVYERLVSGVSCRDYERTVEAVADGYGISKSVVNREMVQSTTKDLQVLCERDLSQLDVLVLMVDGIKVGKSMMVVALGLDNTGRKHILGFREGSTENGRVCLDLLHDLKRRKLKTDHPMLAVIDGSKALRSAIEEFLGDQVAVARCHQHKAKNVKDYLPKEYHAEYEAARRALAGVVKDLGRINIQAAASLEEGFEETLTLHRLGVPPVLRVHLATTNLIESPFNHVRRVMRNVKRWRPNTNQAARWIASGLLQAERRMRRIIGYRSMSVLRSALEAEAVQKAGMQQTNAA
jgi:putative transposase